MTNTILKLNFVKKVVAALLRFTKIAMVKAGLTIVNLRGAWNAWSASDVLMPFDVNDGDVISVSFKDGKRKRLRKVRVKFVIFNPGCDCCGPTLDAVNLLSKSGKVVKSFT